MLKNVKCARCVKCGKEYEATANLTNCSCGGILDIIYDYDYIKEHLNFPNLSEKCHRCIRALSRWSFGAYLVHPLFIESFDIFLHFNTLSLNVFFSVPLLTLIIGALSFLVSALLHQIPFVKKYFV